MCFAFIYMLFSYQYFALYVYWALYVYSVFVNLCCVFTFIVFWICLLCFRLLFYDLNKCIMLKCVYYALKYIIYVSNKYFMFSIHILRFIHMYCVLHLWATTVHPRSSDSTCTQDSTLSSFHAILIVWQ